MRGNTRNRNGNHNPKSTLRNPQSSIPKLSVRFCIAAMVLFLALACNAAAQYSGGAGIDGNPYLIATVQDLLDLSNPDNSADWDKHFRMTADIDMDGVTGFTPIAPDTDPNTLGFDGIPFTGVFDGDGRGIYNLILDFPAQEYVGVFGSVGKFGILHDLGVLNATITGKIVVGGMVGRNEGTIMSCYVTGMVSGNSHTGGLVGHNLLGGTITSCYTTSTISGNLNVGGLVGRSHGTITLCYSMGMVSGDSGFIGGLAGQNEGGSIMLCYATGAVVGKLVVGGLAGTNSSSSSITSCYATGIVTGENYVGGLIGFNLHSGAISSRIRAQKVFALRFCCLNA